MTLKIGDTATVKREYLSRGGQTGLVTDVFDTGVELDFFCDVFGDPRGTPSIEFWAFDELEDCGLADRLKQLLPEEQAPEASARKG